MEIQRLREFLVLAELLSLSKAASFLNIKQPVLSRHLQELEELMGMPLLVRGNGKAGLTPGGERLVRLAREMVSMADQIDLDMRGTGKLAERKAVTIGYTTGLLPFDWLDLIPKFQAMDEDTQVQLYEASPSALMEALERNHIDVALIPDTLEGLKNECDLSTAGALTLRLAARSTDSFDRPPIDCKRFPWTRLIGLDDSLFPGVNQRVRDLCAVFGVDVEFHSVAGGIQAQIEMLRMYGGMAVLPVIEQDVIPEGLCFIPSDQPPDQIGMVAAGSKNDRRPEILQLRKCLAEMV